MAGWGLIFHLSAGEKCNWAPLISSPSIHILCTDKLTDLVWILTSLRSLLMSFHPSAINTALYAVGRLMIAETNGLKVFDEPQRLKLMCLLFSARACEACCPLLRGVKANYSLLKEATVWVSV